MHVSFLPLSYVVINKATDLTSYLIESRGWHLWSKEARKGFIASSKMYEMGVTYATKSKETSQMRLHNNNNLLKWGTLKSLLLGSVLK